MAAEKKQEPVFTPSGTHVYMRNIESGDEWLCPADSVDVQLRRGFFELSEPIDPEPVDEVAAPVIAPVPAKKK